MRSPSRASAKETAKEQDKKDSRSKRRATQRVSPLVDVTEQTTSTDQHSVALDLKRKQRQEATVQQLGLFVLRLTLSSMLQTA